MKQKLIEKSTRSLDACNKEGGYYKTSLSDLGLLNNIKPLNKYDNDSYRYYRLEEYILGKYLDHIIYPLESYDNPRDLYHNCKNFHYDIKKSYTNTRKERKNRYIKNRERKER